jgi:hypothetical protein
VHSSAVFFSISKEISFILLLGALFDLDLGDCLLDPGDAFTFKVVGEPLDETVAVDTLDLLGEGLSTLIPFGVLDLSLFPFSKATFLSFPTFVVCEAIFGDSKLSALLILPVLPGFGGLASLLETSLLVGYCSELGVLAREFALEAF